MSEATPSSWNADTVFREARRRDWAFVWQSHLLAVPITIVSFAGLCFGNLHPAFFFLLPHYFYLYVAGAFSVDRSISCAFIFVVLVLPICAYRALCYYRHAGTSALLSAEMRGRWVGRSRLARACAALRSAALPTSVLVRIGVPGRDYEHTDPPVRRPSRALLLVLFAYAISLQYLPLNYAVQTALCVDAPWTIALPSWAGPCEVHLGGSGTPRRSGCPDDDAPGR